MQRHVSTDEMIEVVNAWAIHHFRCPVDKALFRLSTGRAVVQTFPIAAGPPANGRPSRAMLRAVLKAATAEPVTARKLAREAGYAYGGKFRAAVAYLVGKGKLVRENGRLSRVPRA
jgi:hypothetical protein